MKKLLLGVVLLSGLILSGCSSDNNDKETKDTSVDKSENVVLKDGKYKLEEKNYSNNYRYVLELDVENGNISNVNFDSVNKDGESKRNDKEYIKLMSEKSGTSPDIFLDALEDDLEKVKNPDDVEVISGATHTVDSFKEYAKKLIEQAEEGNTKVIIVDNKTE